MRLLFLGFLLVCYQNYYKCWWISQKVWNM